MNIVGVIFVLFCSGCSGIFALKQVLVNIMDTLVDNKVVSPECVRSLGLYMNRLNHFEGDDMWALKMLDASSKKPVGLLSYNFGEMGHFQQCTEIDSKKDNVKGKYCLGDILFNNSVANNFSPHNKHSIHVTQLVLKISGVVRMLGNPTWAMCLPSSCTDNDAIYLMSMSQPLGAGVRSVTCQTIEDVYPSLDNNAIIGISILILLLLVVLISTTYDLHCHHKNRTASLGFAAFSLYTNSKRLFMIPKRNTKLTCLDGIRVISMMWVILLHMFSVYKSGPVFNIIDIVNLTDSIFSMIFVNGDLSCDTFLVVAGTLVTYVYFKKEKKWKMTLPNVTKYYFHRYIRLTPPLAGVVLVSATLLKYMGSGPKWPSIVKYFQGFCINNWWSTLLYIQNEINTNQMCAGHTWYLDVDMQLYLFSPFILWCLHKYSKTGITIVASSTLASIATSFLRAFREEMSAIGSNFFSKTPKAVYMVDYYLKTETRAAPWLMGILLGYLLTRKQLLETRLSKKILIPMWILCLSVMLLCLIGGHSTLRGPEYYRLENALYIALVRPSFALAVCWMIWACSTNHGGVINTVLSLSVFQLLNKFIYSMYLLHVTTLYMIVFAQKTAAYVTVFNLLYWYWGVFMFMFGLSIIWVLIFESPMINLEKVILKKFEHSTQVLDKKIMI